MNSINSKKEHSWQILWNEFLYGDRIRSYIWMVILLLLTAGSGVVFCCLLLSSCTNDALPIDDDATTGTTATTGPLIVGNLGVDGSSTAPASGSSGASPTTRFAEGTGSANAPWQDGDYIVVSATELSDHGGSGQPISGTYIYKVSAGGSTGTWQWEDNGHTGDDSHTPSLDNRQLYVERLNPEEPIQIESWHGLASWKGSTDYLDQSDKNKYLLQDYLLCTPATLSGRTLSGTLQHQRVDLVLRVTDSDAPNASPAYGNRLPQDAVLRLAGGTPANSDKQNIITAWREGSATGADGKTVTTYRALVALEDVPGITSTTTGSGGEMSEGTVSPGSLLGTMTYTATNASGGPAQKTLRITYSVKESGSSADAVISRGKRINVSATFRDISALDATATLTEWTDTGAGDSGTGLLLKSVGKGANGQPIYELSTAEELKAFAQLVDGEGDFSGMKNPAANARLAADIDLSSICGEGKGSWTPIGKNNEYYTYTGHFDGQGHTVKNLWLNDSYKYAGFFGYIGSGGSVTQLRVEAAKMENTRSSSNSYTGVLAGYNQGTITAACSAAGEVKGTNTYEYPLDGGTEGYGYNYVGGLVGQNNRGTITACYATGNATGSCKGQNYTGGLVGQNLSNSLITACYATGNVTGSSNNENNYAGGLVGSNIGSLLYCATPQNNAVGTGSGTTTGTKSGSSDCGSFSSIRGIVASSAAQTAWGKSLAADGTLQKDANGPRKLDGTWDAIAGESGTSGAIWKSADDSGSGLSGSAENTGHLKLWWEEE